MLKKIIICGLLVFFCLTVQAQDWQTDFEEAKAIAAKENRKIILVFQGSDWCAPCIKLEKEVWSTEEFQTFSQEHFVMLKADFPRKKQNALSPEQQEHNKKLAENYNKSGYFPFVVVLDSTGKVLGETGYNKGTVQEYIKLLNSL